MPNDFDSLINKLEVFLSSNSEPTQILFYAEKFSKDLFKAISQSSYDPKLLKSFFLQLHAQLKLPDKLPDKLPHGKKEEWADNSLRSQGFAKARFLNALQESQIARFYLAQFLLRLPKNRHHDLSLFQSFIKCSLQYDYDANGEKTILNGKFPRYFNRDVAASLLLALVKASDDTLKTQEIIHSAAAGLLQGDFYGLSNTGKVVLVQDSQDYAGKYLKEEHGDIYLDIDRVKSTLDQYGRSNEYLRVLELCASNCVEAGADLTYEKFQQLKQVDEDGLMDAVTFSDIDSQLMFYKLQKIARGIFIAAHAVTLNGLAKNLAFAEASAQAVSISWFRSANEETSKEPRNNLKDNHKFWTQSKSSLDGVKASLNPFDVDKECNDDYPRKTS